MGVAKGESANRAQVLFELGTGATLNTVVTGIVGTGRHLVDDEAAIRVEKELHCEEAHDVEGFGEGGGELSGFKVDFLRGAGGEDRGVQDVMHVYVFRHGKGLGGAVPATGADHRKLPLMLDPFFHHHAGRAAELFPERGVILGGGLEFHLPFTVVAKSGGLDDAGEIDGGYRGLKAWRRVGVFEGRAGETRFFEKIFFALAVLTGVEGSPSGKNGLDRTEGLNDLRRDIFKFQGDAIDPFCEGLQGGGVVVGLIEFAVGDLTGGGRATGFIDMEAVAEGAACENEHTAELAAAENTNRGAGSDHA